MIDKVGNLWHNLHTMTLHQLAKQLDIPSKQLERESLRVFLLTKLGEIEAQRQKILSRYGIDSSSDWDEKLKKGKKKEEGYKGIKDYFQLDVLDFGKKQVIKDLLTFA